MNNLDSLSQDKRPGLGGLAETPTFDTAFMPSLEGLQPQNTGLHTTRMQAAATLAEADLAPAAADAPDASQATRPAVVIMHASVGSGHRSAAYAIAEAFDVLRTTDDPALLRGIAVPHDLDIDTIDVLDYGRIVFDGDKTASMFTGATRPFYDLTWRYTLTGRLLWGGGTIWSRIMYASLTDHIRKKKPLAVICTHITAANAAVGARMLSGLDFPILCVPTDYEIEGLWPHRTADLFCVANEAMAETLRPRKVADEDILITGIPTRDDFRKAYDKDSIRKGLGLPRDKMVVLALAGAYLPRPYIHFRDTLDKVLPYLHLYTNMHFVFIAGRDKHYADHLRQQCLELGIANVTVLDYVEGMASLMAASDLVICKSGGLTVTECLCAQAPMILLGKTYGQEKSNRRMLTASGAAIHVTTARELLDSLRHVSLNPQSVKAMLLNGEFLRRPDAALDIAHAAFARAAQLEQEPVRRKKHFIWFYWGKKPAHTR
ncbi:MAG: UDP-N-acetylglucosamine--LPS N-acetylglucosamine transferase [Coriobacteriaceae bacterium]|jgi:processive 1,2-diacylglycerol beta-glucosyltransferase|nr:UDP-N-acetylglucosamine--LPS N-acetylglucosamine transferase [Coriobacteriaceae bacterium]